MLQSKSIAEQMAEKINAKLGYKPPVEEEKEEESNAGETFKRYEEELEINDFPQTARWKVTSKVRAEVKVSRNDDRRKKLEVAVTLFYSHMSGINSSILVCAVLV